MTLYIRIFACTGYNQFGRVHYNPLPGIGNVLPKHWPPARKKQHNSRRGKSSGVPALFGGHSQFTHRGEGGEHRKLITHPVLNRFSNLNTPNLELRKHWKKIQKIEGVPELKEKFLFYSF